MANSFGEYISVHHRSWRKSARFTRRQLAFVGVGSLTIILLLFYVGLVYQSVAKPLVNILVVGPNVTAGSIHADEDCWVDLSGLFSAVSAESVARELSKHPNNICEHIVSPEHVLKEINSRDFRGSPLMVYLSGVVSFAREHVVVANSSIQAGTPSHTTDLKQLIHSIRNSDASIGVVVLDLTMPDLPGPISLAASHCFEQARIQIDSALHGPGSVPVSIQLKMNRLPRWHELGNPSQFTWDKSILPAHSKCSSQFVDAIKTFSMRNRVEIHEVQNQIDSRSPDDQKPAVYQAKTEWLCSSNWPQNDWYISFSEWQTNTSADENKLPESDKNADESKPALLVQKSLESYRSLLLQLSNKDENAIAPWLSIASPQNYSALHPVAYSHLEKNYFMLRIAHELSPDALDLYGVQSVVEALHDAIASKAALEKVPRWLTSYFVDKVDSACSQVNSIVAKSVLASYGFVPPPGETETDWLGKLQVLLEGTDPVNDSMIIESLKSDSGLLTGSFEYRLLNEILVNEDLEPPIWKELIYTKLLGLRMMSDPLVVSQFKTILTAADRQLIAAERLLFDQNSPDWEETGVQSLKQVKKQFQGVYSEFLASRDQQCKSMNWFYNEVVSLEHFSFPAPQLEPDGGVASDEEILRRYRDIWVEFFALSGQSPSSRITEVFEKVAQDLEVFSQEGTSSKLDFISLSQKIFNRMEDALKGIPPDEVLGQSTSENSVRPLSLLIALHEFRNERSLWSYDPKNLVSNLALFNQQRIADAAHGAQTWEADLLASSSLSWHKIASRLKPHHQYVEDANIFSNSIRIEAPLNLDFTTHDNIDGFIGLQIESKDHGVAVITSEHDDADLNLQLGGKILARGASLSIELDGGNYRPSSLPISVRKLTSKVQTSPMILYVSHRGQKRRAVLEPKPPLPTMVSFELQNQTILNSESSLELDRNTPTILETLIAGNKHNQMLIVAKNHGFREASFSHRILLNQSDRAFPVHGVLDQSKANQILNSFGAMPVAAISAPRLYTPGQTALVSLLPGANFANVMDKSFRELVMESTNETEGRVQFTIIRAKAINPRQYIDSAVTYHSDSQTMEVLFTTTNQRGFPVAGVIAQCELWDLDTGKILATPQCSISPNERQKSIRMSIAGSQSKHILFNVAIDKWKSVFVFEIDREISGVYEPNTSFVGATIRTSDESHVVKTDAASVAVEMDLCINEPSFEINRDWIHIGIDQNLDRTLDGEPVAEVRDTKTHQTVFHGVGTQGEMILESKIEPIKVSIPIELEWNRKGAILAKIVRSGETIYSYGPELTFDKRKPEIRSLNLQGTSPVILGKPLLVEVVTNDSDLSGIELVEGGWSITGEADFHDRMIIVPALSNQNNRWLIALPTATILPGYNTLLVRARDRAGNLSNTYTLPVSVVTEAEYQKQLNDAVTIVRGRLIADYKLMPGSKLKLEIEAAPVSDKQSDTPLSNEEPKVIATTLADENGSFLFSEIPSGKYVLESNVILRGTRIVQRTPIVVDALVGPADCTITVGRQK